MRSDSDRAFLGILLLPLLAIACCVGLPLLVAAGAGAAIWILGAGLPLAFAVVIGGSALQWWRRRRTDPARGGPRRGDASRSRRSPQPVRGASAPGRRGAGR